MTGQQTFDKMSLWQGFLEVELALVLICGQYTCDRAVEEASLCLLIAMPLVELANNARKVCGQHMRPLLAEARQAGLSLDCLYDACSELFNVLALPSLLFVHIANSNGLENWIAHGTTDALL